MEKVRVGLIGLGNRGYSLIGNILACEEGEIVAVCDVYEDRIENAVKSVKEKRGNEPKTYKDYHDLINDENVDAVVIASSWDEHTRMAVASMRAGKYTAVEVAGAGSVRSSAGT